MGKDFIVETVIGAATFLYGMRTRSMESRVMSGSLTPASLMHLKGEVSMASIRVRLCAAVVACLLGGLPFAMAAEPDAAALQALVVEAAEQFEKAFAARDADAISKLFTEEAEYIDDTGLVLHGRDAIAAEYAAHFEISPPGKISVEILSIRPISKGLVVEDGISTFEPSDDSPSSQTRYSATHTRLDDGTWRIASLREVESAIMTPHEHLKALAWFVGHWREENGSTIVDTEWKWSKDGNFLLSEFSAREGDEVLLEGTHRVGWDAERKQFRSWIFDATGGALDGWWTEGDEGIWRVRLSGIDSDGVRISTTASYLAEGKDVIVISQDDRSEGAFQLPRSSHRVVRQPPRPEATAMAP